MFNHITCRTPDGWIIALQLYPEDGWHYGIFHKDRAILLNAKFPVEGVPSMGTMAAILQDERTQWALRTKNSLGGTLPE